MKKLIVIFTIGLMAQQIIQAQEMLTYLSNLGQSSTGSEAVGNDSWQAALFETGNNTGGYIINSIQLGMANAAGSPSGFIVMIYSSAGIGSILPGANLGTLNGSTNPSMNGIYTYTPNSNLTLSQSTFYFIVLTAETTLADGSYEWDYTSANSYNQTGNWNGINGIWTSNDGSSWPRPAGDYFQYTINATAIPEPSSLVLIGLGGLLFFRHQRRLR